MCMGVAHDDSKEVFFGELTSFCSKNKEPFLSRGGFNIMRYVSEKNKRFIPNRFSGILNTIINSNDLREIHICGGEFTWSNNHVIPTLEKLHRVLMSREWELAFPTVLIHKKPIVLFDHNSIIMAIQQGSSKHTREFRFQLTWYDVVQDIIQTREG
jgi:hypothetical protein